MLAGSAATVLVMLWPIARPTPSDGFPLSDYPMFARRRPAVASFNTAVLVAQDGSERRLSPRAIGGTDQAVQAVATVNQAIRTGATDALCVEIAARLEGREGTVEVVTVRYDTIGWFRGDREPVDRVVHAGCRTPPGS